MSLLVNAALAAKQLLYGEKGEPYRIAGQTLRFLPGTRPVRLKYATGAEGVSRYDALEIMFFQRSISAGDVVFDLGAHAGQYAILMSALTGPTGEVVAFEPDPYARSLFKKNIALNPTIKPPRIEAAAVSDMPGEHEFFSAGGNANSSLVRSGLNVAAAEAFTVPVVTLDDYVGASGLSPKWIKIDTEGAEIRILKGAKEVLAGEAGILVELHPYAWEEFGDTYEELKRIVSASGRRMRFLDQEGEMDEVRYGVVSLERA
jgi:FkbM family methyltransferase